MLTSPVERQILQRDEKSQTSKVKNQSDVISIHAYSFSLSSFKTEQRFLAAQELLQYS